MPVYGTGGDVIAKQVTVDALAELDGYLLGIRQWMEAAQGCLRVVQR